MQEYTQAVKKLINICNQSVTHILHALQEKIKTNNIRDISH